MSRRWLITGAGGLLAPFLEDACARDGPVVTTARTSGEVRSDLTDARATLRLVAEAAPDVIVHAAAMTDVDACERDAAAAFAANCDAVANLVAALPGAKRFVQISTDQVYPDTPGPHDEPATGPVNVYGQSKLAGEEAAARHPGALILRTNFFCRSRSKSRASLADFVASNLAAGKPITLFDDVLFSPLHAATLAGLVVDLVAREIRGLYNAGCRDGASKARFGLAVAGRLGLDTASATIGHSNEIAGRAPRPHDLRMAVARIEATLARPMPTLEQEIGKL